jgi:DNA-binding NarL/FixJ family response regulator
MVGVLMWLGTIALRVAAAGAPTGEEPLDPDTSATSAAACAPCEVAISVRLKRLASVRGLTAREILISSHVALGWTNREIAAHLGVGVRTIETHIQHVYRKVGVHNRTRLAVLLQSLTD